MKTLVVSLILLTLTGGKAMAGLIELKGKINIDRPCILLGDLATFKDVDENLLERLKGLRIGSAPLPGRTRTIDLRYIQGRIATLSKKKDLEVLGPEKVEVTRSFQRLDVEAVVGLAQGYILSKAKEMDGEFKVSLTNPPDELILPSGDVKLEVIEKGSLHLGQVYVKMKLILNEMNYGCLRVGFNLQRFQRVVVASRTLNQHQLITREDLGEEMVETTGFVRHSPFFKLDSLIGKRCKRPISEGTIILADMVEIPPLVKRGSIINLKSEIGNVEVLTIAKALQDGKEGERISVRNLSSKESVEGVVKKNNLVVINE